MAAPLCWDLCQNLSFSSSSSRLCGDDGGDDDDDECPSLSPFSSHRLENIQDTPHRHNWWGSRGPIIVFATTACTIVYVHDDSVMFPLVQDFGTGNVRRCYGRCRNLTPCPHAFIGMTLYSGTTFLSIVCQCTHLRRGILLSFHHYYYPQRRLLVECVVPKIHSLCILLVCILTPESTGRLVRRSVEVLGHIPCTGFDSVRRNESRSQPFTRYGCGSSPSLMDIPFHRGHANVRIIVRFWVSWHAGCAYGPPWNSAAKAVAISAISQDLRGCTLYWLLAVDSVNDRRFFIVTMMEWIN